ncbi:class I SAM-dependent methyltransferase [Runella sp.]|uniref:class I SAM-dependent methyltransferase n=1 Tax=Runella sp. TaxID=1960881 RepID=UPI003D110921
MVNHLSIEKGNEHLIQCPSCKSEDILKIGKVPEAFYFGTNIFQVPINSGYLCKCNHCSLYFKNPLLQKDYIDYLYSIQPETLWLYKEERVDFELLVNYITSKKPNSSIGKILDIGCFDGAFLIKLKNRLNNSSNEYYGIEPSEKAATVAKEHGIKIIGKFISDLKEYNSYFDTIVLIDVFEHITDTVELFQALNDALLPNGNIIILTGWVDSIPFKEYQNEYYYVSMPEHILFLSNAHAEFLSQKFSFSVSSKKLFSHIELQKSKLYSIKILIKNSIFLFLNSIPAIFFISKKNKFIRKLLQLRGYGLIDKKQRPDHIMIDFVKIGKKQSASNS